MYIYEVVDVTEGDIYYVLGRFLSFEDAKSELMHKANDTERPVSDYIMNGDYEKIKICERPIGWFDEPDKDLFVIERRYVYDEKADENYWTTIILKCTEKK